MPLYKAINRRRNKKLKRKGAMLFRGYNKDFIMHSGDSRFLELMNASAQGILIQTSDFSPLCVNQAFADSVGYPLDDLINVSSLEHLYKASESLKLKAFFKSNAVNFSSKKTSAFCEVEVKHKLGFDIILQYSISHIKWRGKPAILILSEDVTERKLSLLALSLSEERFRDFAESATDWCWELDINLRFVFVSNNFERVAGFKKRNVLGKRYFEFIKFHFPDIWFTDEQIALTKEFESLLSDGVEVSDFEYFWFSKDGNVFDVRCSGKSIFDESGNCIGYRGTICDISEEKNLYEKLSYQATHDELTGLINRRHFDNEIHKAIDDAHLNNATHVLIFMDLDHFKIVNDTCGHVAGDELLQQLSSMFKNIFSKRDVLGRLGGDEFAVILNHCTVEQSLRITQRLHEEIEAFRFIWEGKTFSLGVSAGVASIDRYTESVSSLLQNVDGACYMAKETGRNKTHIFSKDDGDLLRLKGEMHWVGRIMQALENDDFTLYAQSILAVNHSERPSYELLIRMIEDDKLITPNLFLPASERFDLSINIDRWVVRKAFSWLSSKPDILLNVGCIFINLSGKTIGQKPFLDYVINMFDEYKIPPGKICFEITETTAIFNLSEAVSFINDLKSIGCYFAIDDFGSGVASFAYLKTLPVDYLKIDGTFIRDICENDVNLAMVKSINEISHVMGKKTIAEFVEDEATFEMLKSIGVDYAQGYALGRPFPMENIDIETPRLARV